MAIACQRQDLPMVGATFVQARPTMLVDPAGCEHPLAARRLGGRAGVTIVCMLCGCRADSGQADGTQRIR